MKLERNDHSLQRPVGAISSFVVRKAESFGKFLKHGKVPPVFCLGHQLIGSISTLAEHIIIGLPAKRPAFATQFARQLDSG